MKYFFTLSFILLLSANASAHRSMFGNQSTWWVSQFGTWFMTIYNDTMYVSGDTIVNSINYKKLTSQKYRSTYGLMREDTIAGKVWFKSTYYGGDSTDTAEVLSYDFSLQKGDTFNTWNINYGGPAWYQLDDSFKIVDSVYYENGLKHIMFKPFGMDEYTKEPLVMIEGIGCTYGVLWKRTVQAGPSYLLCAYKDGVQQPYTNVLYNGDCSPPKLSVKPVTGKPAIEVYPNPATDILHIKGADNCSIRITNANGVEVLQTSSVNEIDVSALPAGVYFYFVSDLEKQSLTSGKFIKTN